MNNEETYPHNATCPNCSRPHAYQIQKGVTIREFMSHETCQNCGCRMVATELRRGDEPGRMTMLAEGDDGSKSNQ